MHIGQSHATARANHTAGAEGEELIFRFDLASAIGTLKKLRTESQMIEQSNLIITDDKPRVRLGSEARESFGQQTEESRVFQFIYICKAIQQFKHIGSLACQNQVFT